MFLTYSWSWWDLVTKLAIWICLALLAVSWLTMLTKFKIHWQTRELVARVHCELDMNSSSDFNVAIQQGPYDIMNIVSRSPYALHKIAIHFHSPKFFHPQGLQSAFSGTYLGKAVKLCKSVETLQQNQKIFWVSKTVQSMEGSFWRPFPNRHFHDEMQEMSAKKTSDKNFGQTKKRVNLQGPDLLQSLGSSKLSNTWIP